jgi:ABC-type polysaccharide/polyol phosphate export permease
MNALLRQFDIGLRLHARNKMALLYSYLFPTIFLVAFWVLYRHEQVPLVRHMGELLTVTALGGACFGLPTTMVSEREKGVWRRFRLAPVPTGTLVGGTLLARYVLLILAALLQLGLALAIGMPLPRHPLSLAVAFTCVAFAFIGLGLLIAMMADNVPAVQALGQCIFLPMLILGGVAVPLAMLPDWAQRLSSFFPGRYAVEAIQAAVTGGGLAGARFSLLALLLIGSAACVAGAKMFRWDAEQRFAASAGKGWVALALAAWIAVGSSAEIRGRSRVGPPASDSALLTTAPSATTPVAPPPPPAATSESETPPRRAPELRMPRPTAAEERAAAASKKPLAEGTPAAPPPVARGRASVENRSPAPPPPASPPSAGMPSSWRQVSMADIERDLVFTRLPSDAGIVTPIAQAGEQADDEVEAQLDQIRVALAIWAPGRVDDPVQRVRNLLYVAAVVDVFQMEGLERFLPLVVYERIQEAVPKDDLIKVLYWIALHPFEGDESAVDDLRPFGLKNGPRDMETTRDRVAVYAVKLLGRLTGKIQSNDAAGIRRLER